MLLLLIINIFMRFKLHMHSVMETDRTCIFFLQKNYALTIVQVNLEEFVTHPVDIAIVKMTLVVLAVPSRFPQMQSVNQILIAQKIKFVILKAKTLKAHTNPLKQSAKIHVTIVITVVMVRNVKLRTERQYAHALAPYGSGLKIRIHMW